MLPRRSHLLRAQRRKDDLKGAAGNLGAVELARVAEAAAKSSSELDSAQLTEAGEALRSALEWWIQRASLEAATSDR